MFEFFFYFLRCLSVECVKFDTLPEVLFFFYVFYLSFEIVYYKKFGFRTIDYNVHIT